MPPSSRLRGCLGQAAQVAAALLLALGAGELAVRALGGGARDGGGRAQQSTRFVPDDVLEHRMEPNARWVQAGDRGEFSVEYFTSAEGFRRGPAGPEPPGDEIVVLGNSFVEGWGVPFEKAFIKEAEASLRRGGLALRLSNYGMASYSTVQSYLLLKDLLRTRKPAAALFVFTPGHPYDDQDFLKSAILDDDGLATGVDILRVAGEPAAAPEPWPLRLAGSLAAALGRSELFRLVHEGLKRRHRAARLRPGDPESDRLFFTRPGTDYERPLRATLRYVEAMLALCRAKGVPLLALVMPYGHQVAEWEWPRGRARERLDAGVLYPDGPLLDVERRLEGLGIPTLGLVGVLRRESRRERPLYYSLDIHLNESGNARVGAALATWLKQRLAPPAAEPR